MQIFVRCAGTETRCINLEDSALPWTLNDALCSDSFEELIEKLEISKNEVGIGYKGRYYGLSEPAYLNDHNSPLSSPVLTECDTFTIIPKLRGGATGRIHASILASMAYFSPFRRFPSLLLVTNGFKAFFKDISQFYPPFVPMAYWAIPCAINVSGIWIFKNPDFIFKENTNVSAMRTVEAESEQASGIDGSDEEDTDE